MDFEKIVIDVLSKMGSGQGRAHSEEQLLAEVVNTVKWTVEYQPEISRAIESLISKGIILHDNVMKQWIYLNKRV